MKKILLHGAAYLLALFVLAPFLWVLLTSFQDVENLMVVPVRISLFDMNFYYYERLFADEQFIFSLKNSLIVVSVSTFFSMAICSLGGYAIGALRVRRKDFILFLLLGTSLAPPLVFLIPLFMVLRFFQLIDTYMGLVFMFLTFQVPIGIWILRGFFHSIPRDIFDAATVDGCSRLDTFLTIGLPLARPGIIAVGLFSFLQSWNNLLVPLVVTIHRRTTLTVYASNFGWIRQMNYGSATAVAVLSSIPTILLAVVFRKQLIEGLMSGATKG